MGKSILDKVTKLNKRTIIFNEQRLSNFDVNNITDILISLTESKDLL